MGDAAQRSSSHHLRGKVSMPLTNRQWGIIRALVNSRVKAVTGAPLDERKRPREELGYLEDYKAIIAEIDKH